ncbi:TadE-like protein [Kribbella steppae]|uniref:TadE-like protein n=1 Tax=Kribbella steppae TaxID=2512223 RepID=A0A4R2HE03_9ACTN|nr:TadE family protein [Kribbella steppae]TCO26559.1 TadE-like protein [Kribbella steppae]
MQLARRRSPTGGRAVPRVAAVRDERGSAVVDFVLVSMLVVPLFLGILQVGLYLYVRNTIVAAASEGAHYAAVLNREPADGEARTRELVDGVVNDQLIDSVVAEETDVAGQPGVRVVVKAHMPPLGLWGPGIDFSIEGHAVKETGE